VFELEHTGWGTLPVVGNMYVCEMVQGIVLVGLFVIAIVFA
jgi:hypothetical protein